MTISGEQAIQMFEHDLELVMDDIHRMQTHYRIGKWEAFIFVRNPDCPKSHVVKYAAANDNFAKRIVALHVASTTTPLRNVAAVQTLKNVAEEILSYLNFDCSLDVVQEHTGALAYIIFKSLPDIDEGKQGSSLYDEMERDAMIETIRELEKERDEFRDAATAMRDKCVEKVNELADKWNLEALNPCADLKNLIGVRARAKADAAVEFRSVIQSLTLDQVKPGEQ